jgi:hypothetical protein
VVSVYIVAAYPGRDHAMKADDPRLEASRKELFERIKKMDELILTVLKITSASNNFSASSWRRRARSSTR